MLATLDPVTKLDSIAALICNTPLLAIQYLYRDELREVYAKAEHMNMTGSIKDRMAYHILRKAYETGELRPGGWIVEATSGNTGISFTALGHALGHPVRIYMPEWMSDERKNLLRGLGADVILVSHEEGGFAGCIERAGQFAHSVAGAFLPSQFSNSDNTEAHYLTTGTEIWWQLGIHSIVPEAFVAGVGTGGTIMGVGRLLREKYPSIRLHPLEPSNSPTLSTGYKVGRHRIEGISDEFVPPLLRLDQLDDVVAVDDGDAIVMAQKLAHEIGLGVGISSGANFVGAVLLQNELGADAPVVTVLPDDNKKYLSTDLLRSEPVKKEFLSTDVKLVGMKAFRRVCYTCCQTAGRSYRRQGNNRSGYFSAKT